LWNTLLSDLAFTKGGSYRLDFAGADLGTSPADYNNNFSWGTMDLTGQILLLQDGNADPGGAVYLGSIQGLSFDDLNPLLVTNIFGSDGLNIYYLPDLNPSLNGKTYDLGNGGFPIAGSDAPSPAPGCSWAPGSWDWRV
jgi:hypothetical protein